MKTLFKYFLVSLFLRMIKSRPVLMFLGLTFTLALALIAKLGNITRIQVMRLAR